MARFGFDAEEEGVFAGIGRLDGGGEFFSMHRDNAVIRVSGGDESGRVSFPFFEIVQW